MVKDVKKIVFSPTEKKWLLIGGIVAIVAILIAVSIKMISNTPLGKALSSLMGGLAGLVTAVGAQIKTCNKVGYFNPKGGCYIGVLFIGFAVLTVFCKLVGAFGVPWGKNANESFKKNVEAEAALTGDSEATVIEKAAESIDPDSNDSDFKGKDGKVIPESVKTAGISKVMNDSVLDMRIKSINKQVSNPAEKDARIAEAKSNAEAAEKLIVDQAIEESGAETDAEKAEIEEQVNDAADDVTLPVE